MASRTESPSESQSPTTNAIERDKNDVFTTTELGDDKISSQHQSPAMEPLPRLADITFTNAEAVKEECIYHKEKTDREELSRLYTGRCIWPSIQVDLVARTVKRYGWNATALTPYEPFTKLWEERKHARPKIAQRQTLSFLDLPGEVRNQIYGHLLDFGIIELAAKSVLEYKCNRVRAIHYHKYRRKIKPALRLLRVNKQVNMEASCFFYGQNEFRFTSVCGHDILRAFCKTIGRDNTLRLAKITEHAPIEGDFEDIWDRRANYSKTSRINFNDWLERKGLHQQGHLGGKFYVARTITGKNGSLREYKMVIPRTFKLYSSEISRDHRCLFHYLSRDCSNVKVSLVLLDMQDSAYIPPESPQTILRWQCASLADSMGWDVIEAVSDKCGRYQYPRLQRRDEVWPTSE